MAVGQGWVIRISLQQCMLDSCFHLCGHGWDWEQLPQQWAQPGTAALVLAPSDPMPRHAWGAWTSLVAEPREMLVPTATPICTTKTKQLAQDASEEATREGLEAQKEKVSQPQTAFPYPKSCIRFPSRSWGERDAQQLCRSRRERSRPGDAAPDGACSKQPEQMKNKEKR